MGTITNRINQNPTNSTSNQQSNQSIYNQSNPQNMHIKQTSYSIWQRSNKTIQDLLTYINSTTAQNQQQIKYQRIAIYISGIKQRQKLYQVLNAIQKDILGLQISRQRKQENMMMNRQKYNNAISHKMKSKLIKLVHPKLANIWYIWQQLIPQHHITPSILHQRILPQIILTSYTDKLKILYNLTKQLPALPSLILSQNPSSSSLYFDTDKLLHQTIRTNYPFLLNKQTIQSLFVSIIQNDVIIQDVNHFCYFIEHVIRQIDTNRQLLQDYVQKVYEYLQDGEQYGVGVNQLKEYLEKQDVYRKDLGNKQSQGKIYHVVLQAGRVFLLYGNSHAMQLLFQSIITLNTKLSNNINNNNSNNQITFTFSQSQLKLYLYTQIYSLFMYNLHQLNLQYKHLQKMTIGNIIHLILRGNQISILSKLKDIFVKVGQISKNSLDRSVMNKQIEIQMENKQQKQQVNQYNFQKQICDYIFSNYCPLQICLQILTTTSYITINNSSSSQQQSQSQSQQQQQQIQVQIKPQQQHNIISQQLHNKIIQKLSQSKLQLIIQNQQQIKKIINNNFDNSIKYKDIYNKIQQILEIARLLYMFGVNQKFNSILVFYSHIDVGSSKVNKQQNNKLLKKQSQIQFLQQQKALQLFKIFISKYYISADRTKKIILNSKSQTQSLSVDLSKPQAIFQISQYLYQKLFIKSLNSIKDIYQLIFQHMIYFYKYQQAKIILSNQNILNKYSITIQSFQLLILNNIIQTIQKSTDLYKVLPDLNQQLKLLKSRNSIQVQSAKAMVRLVSQLNNFGIQLSVQDRNKIGVQLMEAIVQKYGDRIQVINFDNLYQQIRAINADYLMDSDQKFMMTNDLLKFKSKLAAKAYQLGKKNLGNQLIDQISRFNPPWITSSLISIFKSTPSLKFDKRIYGIAMKACAKGQDLQYLMELWKQQQGKQKRKQKGFADFAQYFQTGREYVVIDDSFISNQQRYRNFVAESQFNDEMLHLKKYQLFFVLLGTEPERAFHYGLNVGLDPVKIDVFLKQAMKTNIINCYTCINYLHKYFHFAWKVQQQKGSLKNVPSYTNYLNFTFKTSQLQDTLLKLKKQKNKSPTTQFYTKILSAYICSLYITQKFIDTYFLNQQKTNIVYDLLFDEQSRKTLLINLRQQPMGRSDIFTLNLVCQKVIDANLIELCIFNLCNIANTSERLQEKAENIMQKIVTLSSGKIKDCEQIIARLIQKVFSIKKLVQILKFLSSRENPIYQQIIKQRNLEILKNLALIQVGQELHGLVPTKFFNKSISFDPVWPMSANHQKILKRCWAKTNIFVLSKVMYFIYGMNPEIETKVWQTYLMEHPDDEQLRQIKLQLDKLRKYQIQ